MSAWRSARSATWRRSRCAGEPVDHASRHLRARRDPLREICRSARLQKRIAHSDGQCRARIRSAAAARGDGPGAPSRSSVDCLEKTADDRFQTARDLAFALRTLSGTAQAPSVGGQGPASRTPRLDWRPLAAVAALSCAITALVLWMFNDRPSPPPQQNLRRFVFQPPSPLVHAGIALSPDGRRLVYSAGTLIDNQLYERALDAFEAKPLPETTGARIPFFSPDGQWMAFASGGKLRKAATAGGATITLADVSSMLEGTWADDGWIVVAQREHGLMRVSAEGGALEPLTSPDKNAGEDRPPRSGCAARWRSAVYDPRRRRAVSHRRPHAVRRAAHAARQRLFRALRPVRAHRLRTRRWPVRRALRFEAAGGHRAIGPRHRKRAAAAGRWNCRVRGRRRWHARLRTVDRQGEPHTRVGRSDWGCRTTAAAAARVQPSDALSRR